MNKKKAYVAPTMEVFNIEEECGYGLTTISTEDERGEGQGASESIFEEDETDNFNIEWDSLPEIE